MFSKQSRYATIPVRTFETSSGQRISFVQRRFVPADEERPILAEVSVRDGDRLDLIASRTLGNPEQYYRICDANGALDPEELTQEAGSIVRVPLPQV